MSSQSRSSVHSEKRIASYDSLFRESPLSKPLEFSLTITAANLFGQAYVWEQQGTKDGEPIYQRFECPLESITRVYINDNVKASPLYIQCDTNIKGVVHRRRIIIPCLENVSSIVDQITEIHDLHMKKFEAAQQREIERRRAALEKERNESAQEEAKKKEIKSNTAPVLPPIENVKSVKELNEDVEASLKVLESIEHAFSEKKMHVNEKPKAEAADTMSDLPELDTSNVETNDLAPAAAEVIEDKIDNLAVPEEIPEGDIEAKIVTEPTRNITVEITPAAEEPVPAEEAPVQEEAPVSEAAAEVAPVAEPVKEEPAPEPAKIEVVAEPVKKRSSKKIDTTPVSSGSQMSLEDFQLAVKKIKAMRDEGLLNDEEYDAEKKKLLKLLY